MKKILLVFVLLAFPMISLAAEEPNEDYFKARVVEVIESQEIDRGDDSISHQQHLKLIGISDDFVDHEFEFSNIGFDVLAYQGYDIGDKVYAYRTVNYDGNTNYYITDYVRQNLLIWPALIFALLVVVIGKLRGFRAIVALGVSFLVILYFILPSIVDGYNPILITILGSSIIILISFLITYGFNKKSYLAISATFMGLIIVVLLSLFFTSLLRLTGFGVEGMQFLIGISDQAINIQGLLLAGMIIGSIGILTDVSISQVSLVKELVEANKKQTRREVYKKSMNVGVDHIGSMVNTLALAYAGAALPLLILFSADQIRYSSFGQVLNTEMIATEIIRTLVGSIGLILVVPIASLFAVLVYNKKLK